MADTFLLEIVTPSRRILSREVDSLTAIGELGEFGILPGHTQFLTILRPGEITYRKGSEAGHIAAGAGYAEVLPDKTTILVENAVTAEEISVDAAEKLRASSEEQLKTLDYEDPGYLKAEEANQFAQAQLRIKEKRG